MFFVGTLEGSRVRAFSFLTVILLVLLSLRRPILKR